jgi:hypothetical protein
MVLAYKDIEKINLDVHSRFVYTEDDKKKDDWRSHAKILLSDPKYIIKDDCDGLASTVAELLTIKGSTKVWRIMCSMEGGPVIDHMVAMTEDTTGQRWIVGDTNSKIPKRLQFYDGKIFLFNNVNKGLGWTPHP